MEKKQSPRSKISRIDKIEGSSKAQKIISKASSSSRTAVKKPASKTKSATSAKKPRTLTKAKTTAKQAVKKVAKGIKKDLSFRVNDKSLAKIEAFFKNFAKNAEAKNAFIEEAILKHIKKVAKKGKAKIKKLKK